MMKKKKKARIEEDEDQISKLPDDMIHIIMSFLDTRHAVQTSALAKRWRFVWKTLPYLNFNGYKIHYCGNKLVYPKFIDHVFAHRNDQSCVHELELYPQVSPDLRLMKKYVKYSILHRVEKLNFKTLSHCPLSIFSSNSLTKLKLAMKFKPDNVMEPKCWSLPNLTTLHLTCYDYKFRELPEWCLICLPNLKTLCLGKFRLPEIFSFPGLTKLCLDNCILPQKIWNFPALVTLELGDVYFRQNMRDYFRALGSLRNLTIDYVNQYIRHCVISSSQLVNLTIRGPVNICKAYTGKIEVEASKLRNFSAIGLFWTTIKSSEFENVHIKLSDSCFFNNQDCSWVLKVFPDLFALMFSHLGRTKILALDLGSLQALSDISDILVHLHSPFYNLKYLKLPYGYEESSISNAVRHYLLGGSPSATIIKALFPDDVAPGDSLVARNVLLEEPLETPAGEVKICEKNL